MLDAPVSIETVQDGEWLRPRMVRTELTDRRIRVPVPPRFLEMQQQATSTALEWRYALRAVMRDSFERGYRAVDFFLDRDSGAGSYLFAK